MSRFTDEDEKDGKFTMKIIATLLSKNVMHLVYSPRPNVSLLFVVAQWGQTINNMAGITRFRNSLLAADGKSNVGRISRRHSNNSLLGTTTKSIAVVSATVQSATTVECKAKVQKTRDTNNMARCSVATTSETKRSIHSITTIVTNNPNGTECTIAYR